jgi:hypothetical protein
MSKFDNKTQAAASLAANEFAYTQWDVVEKKAKTATPTHDTAAYMHDYARIAAFLCNKGEFSAALKRVSAQMWDAYRKLPATDKNKFTRAMGVVAMARGFDFQNRFQLQTDQAHITGNVDTAPIGIMLVGGDPQLGYMLRNKLFWKDSMDSRHGEHAHSLQWLAIAEGCNTATRASELYRHTGDYRAPSTADSGGARSMLLWQWLCDCFPGDKAKQAGDKRFKNGESLVSDSFRSPQFIMDHLMMGPPKIRTNYFVATYLYNRYRKRGWLAEEAVTTRSGAKAMHVVDIQTTDIKTHGIAAAKAGGWKDSPSSPGARKIRDAGSYVRTAATAPAGSTQVFHNETGFLYQE